MANRKTNELMRMPKNFAKTLLFICLFMCLFAFILSLKSTYITVCENIIVQIVILYFTVKSVRYMTNKILECNNILM